MFVVGMGALLLSPATASADFQFKKGSFEKSDGVAPVDDVIGNVGFQPKAVIFFWTRQRAADPNPLPDVSTGWGFATFRGGAPQARAIGIHTVDNQPGGANRRSGKAQSMSHCIIISQTVGAVQTDLAWAEFVQFEPDGFRIRWMKNEARRDIIHYIALGGSDITDAIVDDFAIGAGVGIQAEAVPFQPDFVMFLSGRKGPLAPLSTTESHHSVGFATATAQVATGGQIEDIGAFGNRRSCVWQRSDSVLALENDTCNPGANGDTRFTVAFTPTGMDVNKVANALSGQMVHYLALKGGRYGVGARQKNWTVAAPPDLDQPFNGIGFRPAGVVLASHDLPADPSQFVQSHGRMSMGASDLATNGATWFHSIDNVSPTDGNMRTATPPETGLNQIAVHASGAAGATINAAGYLKSFDADGFTMRWTTNDITGGLGVADHQILYAAFGPTVQTNYRSIGTAPNRTSPGDGTVTATRGSRVVTGAGTLWKTWNRGRGDRILIDGTDYVVRGVADETTLILDWPFGGDTGAGKAYTISRQFSTLAAWEDCIDGPPGVACPFFPVASTSLVTDNRSEVGIAYDESPLAAVVIDGNIVANTDATHTITLTADGPNRHYGLPGTGAVVDNLAVSAPAIRIWDDYVTVEWLEIKGGGAAGDGIEVDFISGAGASRILLRNNLIHVNRYGITTVTGNPVVDIFNNIIYGGTVPVRIQPAALPAGAQIRLFNNTVYGYSVEGFQSSVAGGSANQITLRNNIAVTEPPIVLNDYPLNGPPNASSSNNMATSPGPFGNDPNPGGPACCTLYGRNAITDLDFVDRLNGNFHILGTSQAVDAGADLSGVFNLDIDGTGRQTPWDIGADDTLATTAVTLSSFTARPFDGGVELRWETASELQNLGFHLYRSESSGDPYTRITSSLISGLGSSPTGKSYSYVDSGLVNGRMYFYKLEDVETTGRTEMHGPVSATPVAATTGGETGSDPGSPGTAYGEPESVRLRELEGSSRHVVLELLTQGFYASPVESGRVRLSIPGFESLSQPGELALPGRRALVSAVAGRKVHLASAAATDVVRFSGLRPTVEGVPELEVSEDGSVRPSRRQVRAGRSLRGVFPADLARLVGTAFQGETKKAEVLLFPLRFDGKTGQLELARRLVVRLEFAGTETKERSLGGTRGRQGRERRSRRSSGVVAQFLVKERGLYRVSYEEVFPPTVRQLSTAKLKLSRQGQSVAFHVTPDPRSFGPGSSLFFLSEGEKLNPYGDAVYELETNQAGLLMPVETLSSSSSGVVTEHFHRLEREENRYYQAGLLDAPDLWQWDVVVSPGAKSYSFTVENLSSSSSAARLTVELQGASDFEGVVDHHVRVEVNGVVVGEGLWDGKKPKTLELEVGAGILREGENTLGLQNVGDTGAAYSMVFLNRFALSYPRRLLATGGRLEGRFETSGEAVVEGLSAASALLDTTGVPRWLQGLQDTASGVRFSVQAGRSYLATSAPLRPAVRLPQTSSLKSTTNRADYLLLAPSEFLPAAQPLLDFRESQGLTTMAVSLEEIYDQFGHGEVSPQAIKEFLEYAYQSWAAASPRYVLLLGDASYDPKNYLKTGVLNRLPGFPIRTSFLWTVSDPAYASVNGEDLIPDIAIGRLPAGSVAEAQVLVQKVLAFENGGGNFQGRAVLVADNADLAGNFEQDADEIATGVLSSRDPQKIYYSQLGGSTRAAIRDAFDQGASFVSYVGHGGTVIWASENIFNFKDVSSLALQPQQPLLLTMNCLNGFFHFPPLNSLSEAFLKAEGKGVIGAFSPSGLSINQAAHQYHKAILGEILSGRHQRMGDAVVAAQDAYAQTGAFPELLSIYHLFGDPALKIQ